MRSFAHREKEKSVNFYQDLGCLLVFMELWPESLLESSNLLTLLLDELEDCIDDRLAAEDDLPPAELSAKTELEDDIALPLD